MVLGDCEEVITTHEIDEETDEEIVRVSLIGISSWSSPGQQTSKRHIDMLFVRGDVVILVSPPLRTA